MENKTIYFSIYDPNNSIFRNRRNRAVVNTIVCCESKRCELYKNNQCALVSSSRIICPYGKRNKESGYTPMAKKYYNWIENKRKQFEGIEKLEPCIQNKMAIVGDYVFLPYDIIIGIKGIPFKDPPSGFWQGESKSPFIKLEEFTFEVVDTIFSYSDTRFWTEILPKFVVHLKEKFPSLFIKLMKEHPEKDFFFKNMVNNVGRTALIYTLKPNIGLFFDRNKIEWKWDGTYLTSNKFKEIKIWGSICDNFSEIRLKPDKGTIVVVTEDRQTDYNTIFID